METAWMGRYRPFVAALVRHANLSSRIAFRRAVGKGETLHITTSEWQALEYLLEHPDEVENMAYISSQLGLAASTFSRLVRSLVKMGFVEKFQKAGNRKDIVLRITPAGREYYLSTVNEQVQPLFDVGFAELSSLSDEQLAHVTCALERISDCMVPDTADDERIDAPRLVPLPRSD